MSPACFTNTAGNIFVCAVCMYISVCERESVCECMCVYVCMPVTPQEPFTLFVETGSLTAMKTSHLDRLGAQGTRQHSRVSASPIQQLQMPTTTLDL